MLHRISSTVTVCLFRGNCCVVFCRRSNTTLAVLNHNCHALQRTTADTLLNGWSVCMPMCCGHKLVINCERETCRIIKSIASPGWEETYVAAIIIVTSISFSIMSLKHSLICSLFHKQLPMSNIIPWAVLIDQTLIATPILKVWANLPLNWRVPIQIAYGAAETGGIGWGPCHPHSYQHVPAGLPGNREQTDGHNEIWEG